MWKPWASRSELASNFKKSVSKDNYVGALVVVYNQGASISLPRQPQTSACHWEGVSCKPPPPPTPTHWWLWNPTVNHIHICMRSLLTSLKRAMPQRKFYNTKSQYPVHPCWAVINVHCGHLDNNGCRIVQTKAQFDKIKNILCNIYLLLKWADFSGALQRQNPNIQKWNMNNKQICEKLCESYRERTICRLFMARTHRMFMARTKTQTLQWLNNIQIVHGYNNTQAL